MSFCSAQVSKAVCVLPIFVVLARTLATVNNQRVDIIVLWLFVELEVVYFFASRTKSRGDSIDHSFSSETLVMLGELSVLGACSGPLMQNTITV